MPAPFHSRLHELFDERAEALGLVLGDEGSGFLDVHEPGVGKIPL